jgi:hypothetical protein
MAASRPGICPVAGENKRQKIDMADEVRFDEIT